MSRLRIVHLSDPHFGTILPGMEDALIAAIEELKPGLILLTGDITQRARAAQFRAARNFTHRLKAFPFIAVPGNHDIPLFNVFARLFHPYRGFKKLFKDQLEKDFDFGDVQVLGLNSTSKWRHVQGDFDMSRLRGRLNSAKTGAKVRIAAFHHPMDCAKDVDRKNLLRGREEALGLFGKAHVDLIVGGHVHDPHAAIVDGMVVAVAGTCLSWRTRKDAPNSFNVIDVDTHDHPELTIARYDFQKDKTFAAKLTHRFRRQAAWTRI